MATLTWEEIGEKKRAALFETFPADLVVPDNLLPPADQDNVLSWPETSGWFTKEELEITNATASELVPLLASGKLKSETATRAFMKRAVAAHQLTNCLSETCFERAISTAKRLDEHLAKTGKPVGPLHGLPVSLKDNFNIVGLDSTVGFTALVGDKATSDSALVTLLESLGIVPYVKTNVPTAMMIAETVNNTFGRTTNPNNRKFTPGGSSGGEGALISFKGSPLGVGSDIGGSLRIPAASCGLFTIRSSGGRFPVRGCRSGMAGQEAVMSVNGPLARSLEDIEFYFQSVVGAEPWLADAKSLPLPWRVPVALPPKLKIGVIWNDTIAMPTPPIVRALKFAVDKLKAAGHEVVDWDPVDQPEGNHLLARMFVADGGKAIQEVLARTNEPLRPEMAAFGSVKELGTADMWKLQIERSAYQNKYLDRWNAAGLDALLSPTMPFAVAKHGESRHFGYTGIFNVLDYSAVSFPCGLTVDKSIDKKDTSTEQLSDVGKLVQEDYDPEALDGLPISLQLVARRLEEEKVIAMTKVVLSLLSA